MKGTAALLTPSPTASLSLIFDGARAQRLPPRQAAVACSGGGGGGRRSSWSIPKLEPFSRSRIERWIKDPPFLQKSENDLTEYCTTLEGDDSYSCWRAYFELKDLEKEMAKEDVEKIVRQAGGLKSLIGCLHGITAALKNATDKQAKKLVTPILETNTEDHFPVPDGLPKTKEELDEEERDRMPDSPFTTMLRSMGKFPAWYSQSPDHETA